MKLPALPVVCSAALLAFLAPAVLSAADSHDHAAHLPAPAASVTSAIAVLHHTEGYEVHGTVRFTQVEGGVRVQAHVTGLTPGDHGFHVHEFGDVSAPDGMSTGGHFNPAGHAHGAPDAAARHVGDLGNLTADAGGRASLDFVDTSLALNGPHSIIGRGLIVHADADDLKSQPTGNAGKRVAAAVIGVAKP